MSASACEDCGVSLRSFAGRLPTSPTRSEHRPRPTAHLRHDTSASRRAPQGRTETPQARQRRHYPRHLLARLAEHAVRRGRRDRCGNEKGAGQVDCVCRSRVGDVCYTRLPTCRAPGPRAGLPAARSTPVLHRCGQLWSARRDRVSDVVAKGQFCRFAALSSGVRSGSSARGSRQWRPCVPNRPSNRAPPAATAPGQPRGAVPAFR